MVGNKTAWLCCCVLFASPIVHGGITMGASPSILSAEDSSAKEECVVEIPKITIRNDRHQDISTYVGKIIQIDTEIMAIPLEFRMGGVPILLVGVPYEQQEQITKLWRKSLSEGFGDVYRLTGYLSFREDWYAPPKDSAGTADQLKPRIRRTYLLVVQDMQEIGRVSCPMSDPFGDEEDSPTERGTVNDPSSDSYDPFADP